MEVKTFYNGNTMPKIGLGTFRVENDENCMESVKYAIEQGYRSIDTAKVYGNEEQVGAGIRAGLESTGIAREDLFITSKLYFEDFGRENVAAAYEASLSRLGLKYLDLYLVHYIVMESWSPLMNAQILNDEAIKDIAQELGKSPAQVVLRWNVQHGVVTIPKSVTPNRISENFQIFDFELSDEQMTRIDGLNQDKRIGPDPKTFEG
ncbi:TPA: aldo/keto reductase [Staphylococcus aureus]|nr:aldo/keto reductase [Staphylococcus aureus]